MKRILILLMALSVLFATGCSKKAEVDNTKEKAETKTEAVDKAASDKKDTSESTTKEDVKKEDKSSSDVKAPEKNDSAPEAKPVEEKAPEAKPAEEKAPEKSSESSTSQEAPTIGGTDLESAIDEFNNTEDPKRREELREELEDFFAMFEGTTVETD